MNWGICFFVQAVIFTTFIWTASDKVLALSPWPIQILDLSMNITFSHDCFSLLLFNLSLCVRTGFRLAFLYVNPTSFSLFLPFCHKHWLLLRLLLFFIYFVGHFLFLRRMALTFISWRFNVFRGLLEFFSF